MLPPDPVPSTPPFLPGALQWAQKRFWLAFIPVIAVAAALAKPAASVHIVVTGDTLGDIAQMHGMSLSLLRSLNGIDNDLIRAGDQLAVMGLGAPRANVRRTPRALATAYPQATKTISTPVAATAAVAAPVPTVWEMPPWTSAQPANVVSGETYWRLIQAVYFDEARAGGRVNIFTAALDETGKALAGIPVKLTWGIEVTQYVTRKTETKRDPFLQPFDLEVIAEHEMGAGSSFSPERGERGGYKISIEGSSSDVVEGMGLPLRRHVAFLLVFQRTLK